MHYHQAFIFVAASVACGTAHAGKVSTTYVNINEGSTTALLEASSQYHIDAARRLVDERYPEAYSTRRWETIEEHLRTTPIARLDYEYTINGHVNIRTYHAMSGEPLGLVVQQALEGPTPPETPTAPKSFDTYDAIPQLPPDGERDQLSTSADEQRVSTEMSDDAFYGDLGDSETRAPFRPSGASVMPTYHDEAGYHGLDAEYKSLRALEQDIFTGKVPRGGIVRGMLSGTSCATCRYSVERFAKTYQLDVRFSEMSPSVPSRTRNELVRSGRARMKGLKLIDSATGRPMIAFDALADARHAQVQERFSLSSQQGRSGGQMGSDRSFLLSLPDKPRISEQERKPNQNTVTTNGTRTDGC
ncbi:hypothetical protein GCM10009552_32540 [Rothia nasimurium]|uniref:Uncharacterized protein n=1 Tax=Luteibacter anthropi TaxID=564369 RepID=A0A7X5UDD9_9GAMM|nr:hypothetical protein [Luteibacter anthropi]NII08153.1 hypothetical protein [Luteibacter anthropi]